MSEYTELTAKIEALEKRVKYLEDTFATLADMNKSGEMAQYIAQRQRALVASKLVNAAAGTQKLNADVQQQVLDQLAAEKAAMDARIEEAIRASEQNAPAEDDLAEQFTYREVPGGVEIQGFNGFETGDELLLPQKINGKPVVGIGKEAFAKMTFKKVILPEEIHYIGINAFWECKQLAVANLPESLKELCFGCFSGTGLRQIKIPSKCKEIPEKCFKDCKQLQTVVLNDGLERIKREACNGVQRKHNKKLNNGLPILHKVPPKRDYGRYFCIMAEKGGTSHGGLTEKLSPFFHAKKQEVNAYGR